jgi:iron complex outermembrane recepter protein
MQTNTKGIGFGLSTWVLTLASAFPAGAQQPPQSVTPPAAGDQSNVDMGIEDIVVTAQRREENLQRVPIAVSAIKGEVLEMRGIEQVADLARATPALDFGKASGILQPVLRGLGNLSTPIGNESSIALYVDGVFYSRLPTAGLDLNNIERVEVLRGPQGTLFGRNSSGGVIQIVTKDASFEPSMSGQLSYGRLNIIQGSAYGTAGISKNIAVDISVSGRSQDDGFGRNVTTGGRSGYEEYFGTRTNILFKPSDQTSIRLGGFHTVNYTDTDANTFPGTTRGYESLPLPSAPLPALGFWDKDTNYDIGVKGEQNGASLHIRQALGNITLSSITAYSRTTTKTKDHFDSDFGARDDANAYFSGYLNLFTQEIQLSSADDGPLDWTGGLYYYHTKARYNAIEFRSPSGNALPPTVQPGGVASFVAGIDSNSRQIARSYAAYGQATYEIADGLKFTGGVRFTHDKTSAEGSILLGVVTRVAAGLVPLQLAGASAHVKDDRVTYRAALSYDLTRDTMIYVSHSTGYKAAVFNLLLYNPSPAAAERVSAYEAGIKTKMLENHVRLNAAAFWYDIRNPQVQIGIGTNLLFSNAPKAQIKGLEAEAEILVADGLTLRINGSYLDAQYRDYPNAVCTPENPNPPFGRVRPFVLCDAAGNRLPRASKFTGAVGVQFKQPTEVGEFLASVDLNHNSGYFFFPSNDLHQKAYDLLEAQITYKPNDNFSFKIWGKNLTNTKYAYRAFEQAGPVGSPYTAAEPQTYGVTLGFDF